jgi:uncharacterized protein YodC (DUF2158 family)
LELKVGDVVRLKSGSPKMTITEIGKYGYSEKEQVKCIWFDANKKCEDLFEKETLEIYTQPKPVPIGGF